MPRVQTQVLFIQGGSEGAYEADHLLANSLQQALGNGYRVRYPRMANEDDPQYDAWKTGIEVSLAQSRGAIALVGHSLGAFMLVRYLAETRLPPGLIGLFLIATPFVSETEGWRFPDLAPPESFAKKLNAVTIFLYHSRDDEVVPFEHLALYRARLPRATVHMFEGRGHQFRNDLTEVADDIRRRAMEPSARLDVNPHALDG
jgi:predicted alpha/beta hydrolase family esterase